MQLGASETVEKKVTEEVCRIIKEQLPSVKMWADCKTVLSALWDKIKTQSPKSEDNFMALPTPEEIGELVCKFAASEIDGKEATEIFKERFPSMKL